MFTTIMIALAGVVAFAVYCFVKANRTESKNAVERRKRFEDRIFGWHNSVSPLEATEELYNVKYQELIALREQNGDCTELQCDLMILLGIKHRILQSESATQYYNQQLGGTNAKAQQLE